jgi:ABC-type antimicrobial peptide transport system permease subunit
MRLVFVGLAAGALLAPGAARMLESLLFGVTPLDPWTYAASAALLALAGLIACGAPAYRAARLNPNEVLRQG